MAGRPLRRARLAAKLADQFPPAIPPDAIPMNEASQELKDARAAMSVMLSPLDANAALVDMYPEAAHLDKAKRTKMRTETTQSERVKMILRNDLSDLEQQRKALVSHMVSIALNREDPDNAIRAFSQLAKVAGWAAPIKVEGTMKNFNIHSMLNDPSVVKEALALMNHEPGAPVAIQSDARDDYERRQEPADE